MKDYCRSNVTYSDPRMLNTEYVCMHRFALGRMFGEAICCYFVGFLCHFIFVAAVHGQWRKARLLGARHPLRDAQFKMHGTLESCLVAPIRG